jgi:hypothetical protein
MALVVIAGLVLLVAGAVVLLATTNLSYAPVPIICLVAALIHALLLGFPGITVRDKLLTTAVLSLMPWGAVAIYLRVVPYRDRPILAAAGVPFVYAATLIAGVVALISIGYGVRF